MANPLARDALLQILLPALESVNVKAFLRLICEGESGQEDNRYRKVVGGQIFEGDLSQHPRIAVQTKWGWSSAFGAYQIMAAVPGKVRTDTYDWLARELGPSMEPPAQDLKAVRLIHHAGALDAVIGGRIREAIRRCAKTWASLPGSSYGQPTQAYGRALKVYEDAGGQVAEEPQALDETESEVKPVGAILALLPSLIPLIPQLGQLFGSGSEVQQRNVAAASIVADTVVKATGSPNFQAAIEKMQGDPEAVKAAQAAIADVWPTITESGGGGIKGARDAALNPDQIPFYRNPAFVISMAILPLIYMVAIAVLFGVGGQSWSDDIKTLFVTAIVSGALGSIQGFFLGSSLGSQKKDALIGK